MDKKRLKIALAVLDAVKSRFPETQEFLDSTLKKECEREKMTANEVIFLILYMQRKISLNKHFCFRFVTVVIISFVYRYGKAWQILKKKTAIKRRDKKAIIRIDDHRRKSRI